MNALPRHLVLVTTSFPEVNDGREAAGGFVLALAQALAGHTSLTVLAPGAANGEETGSFTVRRFAVPRRPLSLLRPFDPRDWSAIMATLVSGARELRAILAKTPADHLLCLWALPGGFWARHQGVPYSVWTLGSDIWSLGRIPVVKSVLRRVLRDAVHCFADGEQLRQDTARIGGRECLFLPSSRRLDIRPTAAARGGPPHRLAFLGRWHPNKGPDLLLDALTLLPDSCWSRIEAVRLAGGGPMEKEVREKAALLCRAGRPISLEGYKSPTAAADLLSWADFVLIPSRIESIPVIFSDAMQCRRPVVSTPVGDLPVLVRRYEVGIVARDITAASYAKALDRALSEGPAAFSPGLATAAADFDVERTAQQLLALLFSS